MADLSIRRKAIEQYRTDPESIYNTWFVRGAERIMAFRAIRVGVRDVVDSIAAGSFGNDFRGSPLEVVLTAITEQKQVFEGAAHPFYWKPKLRIPDIYENAANQRRFGAFLVACLTATRDDHGAPAMAAPWASRSQMRCLRQNRAGAPFALGDNWWTTQARWRMDHPPFGARPSSRLGFHAWPRQMACAAGGQIALGGWSGNGYAEVEIRRFTCHR